jgi:hypothetical protein
MLPRIAVTGHMNVTMELTALRRQRGEFRT